MKLRTWVLQTGIGLTWLAMGLAVGLAVGLGPGCKKPPAPAERSASKPTVQWPARPKDGSPVALSFAAMAYKGDRWGAELRVFSFANRAVRALQLTFHFLDKGGAELSRIAYPNQGRPLVGPGAWVTLDIGATMPRKTDKVTVTLNTVLFMDGSSWKRPSAAMR